MAEKKKKNREDTAEKDKKAPRAEEILDTELMLETAAVARTKGPHPVHCLTIAGQVEGHTEAPVGTKVTKYEHVIPLLVAVEEDPDIEGLLILLNTVGGDVEAGLAIAELIAGMKKPTVSLVLGGGHSIGIPLAVAASRSFIAPSATMTVHPVRHTGMVLGVPQTMRHFDRMQQRITGFICAHSHISEERFSRLLMRTGELVLDVGTVLEGPQAVEEGLIDEVGGLADAMRYLQRRIARRKKEF